MNRGEFVTVTLQGAFGKPRPALIIQSDHFSGLDSVTVLPVTSTLVDAPLLRVSVAPDAATGLKHPSQVMIDKVVTVKRDKVGPSFGHLDQDTQIEIDRRLALFLGVAK